MSSVFVRIAYGFSAALLLALLANGIVFDIVLAAEDSPLADRMLRTFAIVLGAALTLGLPLIALTESLRWRSPWVYAAFSLMISGLAASAMSFGATISADAAGLARFSGLVVTSVLPALVYWRLSGQLAGWRGADAERADQQAIHTFQTVSADAAIERCWRCVAGRVALGLILFAGLSWAAVRLSGLHEALVKDTESAGQGALETSGHHWARFRIDGDRGVVSGLAPTVDARKDAYNYVRVALAPVTGVPGVISDLDNEAIVNSVTAPLQNDELKRLKARERAALAEVEAAQQRANAAQSAEAEARRQADERLTAANEAVRKLERQLADAEAAAQARAIEAAERAAANMAATAAAQQDVARAADAATPPANADDSTAAEMEVAALPPEPNLVLPADEIDDTTDDTVRVQPSGTCTEQDLAIIESSRILFAEQRFDVEQRYEGDVERLAASAKACAPRPVQITGFADARRDSLFNPSLPSQRAQALRDHLVAHGVSAGLVITMSGGQRAIDDGSATEQERALLRRVELRVLEETAVSRDATLDPEERAKTCERELADIMTGAVIYFPTASSRVRDDSLTLIQKLAHAVKNCGSVVVTVEGHTDKVGTEGDNQMLSEQRANAVRQTLVDAGADPTRLMAQGFSSTRPSAAGDTAEALALNRRIEFKVSGKFTSTAIGGP